MDSTCQLAQLVEPLCELVLGNGQDLSGGRRLLLELHTDQGEVDREGYQPLLCAIVQVALEPPALRIRGLHDPRSGRRQLLVRVGVGERLSNQLREVAQALFDIPWQW